MASDSAREGRTTWDETGRDETARDGIPATLFRGGTSKGVYFERDALPDDEAARENP